MKLLLQARLDWERRMPYDYGRAVKADQTAISVLPTGAGKIILFMLPAVMRDR
jgi:hypothetical protein